MQTHGAVATATAAAGDADDDGQAVGFWSSSNNNNNKMIFLPNLLMNALKCQWVSLGAA